MIQNEIIEIMRHEMLVTRGCTEPAAIAFTAATAASHVGKIDRIEISASIAMIKNAMSVSIPGTNGCGVSLAAALGAILKDNKLKLDILSNLTAPIVNKAKALVSSGSTEVKIADSPKKLYIDVTVYSNGSYARAVVEDEHTNITHVEVDGKILQSGSDMDIEASGEECLTLETIWDFVRNVNVNDLSIVRQSIELNRRISIEGITNPYGLEVGKTLYERSEFNPQKRNHCASVNEITNYAVALTAAGSDARMAGCELSAMSNSGSGNQGITATMPVVAVWEKEGLDEETLLRAVTLSQLVTIHIKSGFGRLSALCGATIAATGASCGIVYLYGGSLKEVRSAIQNMFGNVTGILCDGAKAGCALKVSTCTAAAVQSAMLAMKGITIAKTDGIVEQDADKTIGNICRLANFGTSQTDKVILDIMLKKANSVCEK